MKKNKFYKSLSILTLSIKYLSLVKNVVGENVKQGNSHIIDPYIITGNETIDAKKYKEITKWSDFNISSPILFNFYHGLELVLKGLLVLKKDYDLETRHHIEKLFREFKKNYNEREELISILDKYLTPRLMPSFLANCLRDNNIQINNLYEFFRYPFDKKFQKEHNYFKLKYREKDGLSFFKELEGDIDTLLNEIVKLYRETKKEQKTS